jgi:hypothetical protein
MLYFRIKQSFPCKLAMLVNSTEKKEALIDILFMMILPVELNLLKNGEKNETQNVDSSDSGSDRFAGGGPRLGKPREWRAGGGVCEQPGSVL